MPWVVGIALAVLFVAFANGANDNFKGVATLFGSGTTNYATALSWAAVTTFSGSIAAVFLATRLVHTFTGKGLVPDAFVGNPAFLAAAALGTGLTVFSAARLGIPISTTHGLTGALVGAGLTALGTQLGLGTLGKSFVMPLLLSPLAAAAVTALVYFLMHRLRKILGVSRQTCLCVGEKVVPLSALGLEGGKVLAASELRIPQVILGTKAGCEARALEAYDGKILGLSVQSVLDFLHFLSAGAVSFARGLNDTPKIVALLVAVGAGFPGPATGEGTSPLQWPILFIASAMALGGILGARKVAETVSHRITPMNHGQGLTANGVTAILVISASHWGMPVSTTHVSCGALFGIGLVNGKARWDVIRSILGAWVLTLPVAAALSGVFYWFLRGI